MTSPLHNPAMDYRKDIDGLRAIAVLGVLLYHFGLGGISGGFVGVDVFFVISGYLITTIIQREIESRRFSFLRFYERRIRRIFPALFTVLIATLLVGLYVMLPSDLTMLGKALIATLAFASNIFFWKTSGYFDPVSKTNPLLHTWSLSIEEQFYIFLPIGLILVHRFFRGRLPAVLLGMAVLSLAACLVIQAKRPEASFYLMPFRAWELLIGAYLAVAKIPRIQSRQAREWLSWASIALLALGYAFITEGPAFPGWYALVPTLATAMLLHTGGSGDSSVKSILSLKPIVFIGLVSYSLYLWHWPVAVFSKYTGLFQAAEFMPWLLMGLSFALAVASYYLIETPFRVNKGFFSVPRIVVASAFVGAALGISGFVIWKSRGFVEWFPNRYPPKALVADMARAEKIKYRECSGYGVIDGKVNRDCIIGDKKSIPTIVVWGDSHANSWAPALDQLFYENKISAVLLFTGSCPPLFKAYFDFDANCMNANLEAAKFIRESRNIKFVVMGSKWSYHSTGSDYMHARTVDFSGKYVFFENEIKDTIDWLKSNDKKLWLIGPLPYVPETMIPDYANALVNDETYEVDDSIFAQAINRSSDVRKFLNIEKIDTFSDPVKWVCPDKSCRLFLDGVPMYRDGHHLSRGGAMALLPYLRKDFARFMVEEETHER